MYGCIFMEHRYICMYNNNRYDHVLYRALYSLQSTYHVLSIIKNTKIMGHKTAE